MTTPVNADPSYDIQVAMAAALLADSAVTALVGQNVVDPLAAPNTSYPLIEIGDDQVIGTADQSAAGSEVYSTIHVWANGPWGRLVAKQIVDQVRRVLSEPLTLANHQMNSALFHSARFFVDTDPTDQGQIAHGVVVFQFRTLPTV